MKILTALFFALLTLQQAQAGGPDMVIISSINVLRDIDAGALAAGDDHYNIVAKDAKSGTVCRVHVDVSVTKGTSYAIARDGTNATFLYSPGYVYIRSNRSGPGLSIDCYADSKSLIYVDSVNDALKGIIRLDFAEQSK